MSVRSSMQRIIIAEIEDGAFFGEAAMLSDEQVVNKHTVIALEFVELIQFSKAAYQEMVNTYSLHDTLGRSLEQTQRSRLARMRWKVAYAKVRAVNRLKVKPVGILKRRTLVESRPASALDLLNSPRATLARFRFLG